MNHRIAAAAMVAAIATVAGVSASASNAPEIRLLSNRAGLVRGGNVMVEIVWPNGKPPRAARIALNGQPVKGPFADRHDGRYLGGVEGLRDGIRRRLKRS